MFMRMIRILGTSFRDGAKSIIRHFSLSFASIICTTITLVLLSVAIIVSFNVNKFTNELKNELTIVAFANRGIDDDVAKNLAEQIRAVDNIESVVHQNKEEVKEQIMVESPKLSSIMSKWTKENNPLQEQYIIRLKDVDTISQTAKTIEELDDIDTVKYGEGKVESILSGFDIIYKSTWIVVASLIIVTIFLVSNTIKITIFSRREEIEITRLVGASNTTIKLPFVFEGMILGILGAVVPILITIYGYIYLYNMQSGKIISNAMVINLIEPMNFVFMVSAILLGIAIVVGMISSSRSVRKYLKI